MDKYSTAVLDDLMKDTTVTDPGPADMDEGARARTRRRQEERRRRLGRLTQDTWPASAPDEQQQPEQHQHSPMGEFSSYARVPPSSSGQGLKLQG